MNIDLKQLRELMRAAKTFGLSELEIESNGERVRICRSAPGGANSSTLISVPPAGYSWPPPEPPAPIEATQPSLINTTAEEDPRITYIASPFVGTFYRAPSPETPAFVDKGQAIKPGQVLCIVEAMKLMNEIEAEISGVIVEILADNGKAVEYGERLFKVRREDV